MVEIIRRNGAGPLRQSWKTLKALPIRTAGINPPGQGSGIWQATRLMRVFHNYRERVYRTLPPPRQHRAAKRKGYAPSAAARLRMRYTSASIPRL